MPLLQTLGIPSGASIEKPVFRFYETTPAGGGGGDTFGVKPLDASPTAFQTGQGPNGGGVLGGLGNLFDDVTGRLYNAGVDRLVSEINPPSQRQRQQDASDAQQQFNTLLPSFVERWVGGGEGGGTGTSRSVSTPGVVAIALVASLGVAVLVWLLRR